MSCSLCRIALPTSESSATPNTPPTCLAVASRSGIRVSATLPSTTRTAPARTVTGNGLNHPASSSGSPARSQAATASAGSTVATASTLPADGLRE